MSALLSDADVFGGSSDTGGGGKLLSDDEVFGASTAKPKYTLDITGTPTEVSPDDHSTAFGSVARGFLRGRQAAQTALADMGFISPEKAAKQIAQDESTINADYPMPPDVRKGFEEIGNAKGWGETALAYLRNPQIYPTLVGEMTAGSIESVLPGLLAGGPVSGPVGAGLGSFFTDYSSTMFQALQDNNVDVNDPKAVGEALKNPDIMHDARVDAAKHGIPVAVFDMLSFGIAGRLEHLITGGSEVARIGRRLAGQGAEVGAQATLGAAGEAAGEAGQGQPLDPSNIIAEGLGEVVTGVPEIAAGEIRMRGERAAASEAPGVREAPERPLTAAGLPEGARPADTLFGAEEGFPTALPAPNPEIDRPDSPRLTPEDRASPIPNNLIDDGKAIIADALKKQAQPTAPAAAQLTATKDAINEQIAAELGAMSPKAMGGSSPTLPAAIPGRTATAAEMAPRPGAIEPTSTIPLLTDEQVFTRGETHPEPTPAQAEAGNYPKRHVSAHGLDVSIETEEGGTRRSKPGAAEPWEVTMPAAYGYVRRTTGADGDQVDVYLGKHHSDVVHVIDQINPETKAFDEHKAMIDFANEGEARTAYERAFSDGKGLQRIGKVTKMSMQDFKAWLQNGDTSAPLSYKAPVAAAATAAPQAGQQGKNEGEESPSFYREFNQKGQDVFDGLPEANRDVAWKLGQMVDKMRADGNTERADRLAKKLQTILMDIMPREEPAPGHQPKPRKATGGVKRTRAVTPDILKRVIKLLNEGWPDFDAAVDEAYHRAQGGKPNPVPVEEAVAKAAEEPPAKVDLPKGYEIKVDAKGEGALHGPDGKVIARSGSNTKAAREWLAGKAAAHAQTNAEKVATPPKSEAPEHAAVGVDDRELGQIVTEFNQAQERMIAGEESVTHVFDAPKKSDIVRLGNKTRVYHKEHGWMTPAEAKKVIASWKANAEGQGADPEIRSANSKRVVLSLFDLTGAWSQPWEDAGYQVFRFDIQNDPEAGDVNAFSTDFFGDWFGDFDGQDIYAILAACPCTDFASSGARHFAAKDKDGRTVASVKLVHQTLATIEYFKPAVWALENPVGRIEKLGGLPPWRLSFDPNDLGDPYTKKTLLWGRFNADLPIAPVDPVEGSKMWAKFGGKSLKTKNARSETPEGFSYGFFQANNAHDHPAMAIAHKFDRLDPKLIDRAVKAGVTEEQITEAVEDLYYQELDDEGANEAIRALIPTGVPPAGKSGLAKRMRGERGPIIERNDIDIGTAITASGRELEVVYSIVSADELVASQTDEGTANPDYPAELQPRDRSRAASTAQIAAMAQKLNPVLLDKSPRASGGAPIIADDGVVESGNGRVLAIRRAYAEGMPSAKAYAAHLKAQGYPVEGIKNPVLVRIREGDMPIAERQAFTREANERGSLGMSATERAMTDAKAMSDTLLAKYRGGDVDQAGNRDFVRGFIGQIVSAGDRANMATADGSLSQEAIRRIQGALLAKAYGNPELVSSLIENTDTNIKAIGGALLDIAPQWAQMRSESADGSIAKEVDQTDRLLEAVRLVQRARSEGQPLAALVNQQDIFSGQATHPFTELFLSLMFRNNQNWNMPVGRDKLSAALAYYVQEARKTTAGTDMLGERAPAADTLLRAAKARLSGEGGQQRSMFKRAAPVKSQAFRQWFGKSKVTNPNGTPKVVYHGTHADFEQFAISDDIGFHFGTKAQAEDRISFEPGGRVIAAYLKIENPLRLPDLHTWSSYDVLNALVDAGVLEQDEADEIDPEDVDRLQVKRILEQYGHDGIVYRNETEGAGDSYIVFEPTQVKSVDNVGTFSPADPRMRFKLTPNSPEIEAAIAAMDAIPHTDQDPNYGSDEWLDNRVYDFSGGKPGFSGDRVVGFEQAIPRLVDRARAMAGAETGQPHRVVAGSKATIVIGPPAAGKSTIANYIALKTNSAIVDPDDAKQILPEYQGGIGANAVHEESSDLAREVMRQLRANEENMVIPKVGHNLKGIDQLREELQSVGYTVELVLMEVTPDVAMERMLRRYERTGRLINPRYFAEVAGRPRNTYLEAIKQGKFDGFTRVSSPEGLPARVEAATGQAASLARGEELDAARAGGSQRTAAAPGDAERRSPQAGIGREPPQYAGGEATITRTPADPARAAAIRDKLEAELSRLGLKGVGLKLWDAIVAQVNGETFEAEGHYLRGLIDVSLNSAQIFNTLGHEALHALRDLGAFTDAEWAILERRSAKEWVKNIEAGYQFAPREVQIEEGIANAFGKWIDGARVEGLIARTFKKIRAILRSLYTALTGHDIRTAEDLFELIRMGRMAPPVQTVYHGTGADFGQFSNQAVTGTGGRGWGLYFSSKKAVAEHYRGRAMGIKTGGSVLQALIPSNNRLMDWDKRVSQQPPKVRKALLELGAKRRDTAGQFYEQLSRRLGDGLHNDEAASTALRDAGIPGLRYDSDDIEKNVTNFVIFDDSHTAVTSKFAVADVTRKVGGARYIFDDPWQARYFDLGRALLEANAIAPEEAADVEWPSSIAYGSQRAEADILFDKMGRYLSGDRVNTLSEFAKAAMESAGATLDQGKTGDVEANSVIDSEAQFDWNRGLSREQHGVTVENRQAVIPGAEQLSNRAIAERRAQAPKRSSKAQKDTDGLPLFNDQSRQGSLFEDPADFTGPDRFKLKRAPSNQAESQAVMQGWLARGQFVDRAIRLPFQILGGTVNGSWVPGKRINEKVGEAGRIGGAIGGTIGAGVGTFFGPVGTVAGGITGGTIGAYLLGAPMPKRFTWLNGIMHNARAGLVHQYGLDDAYIEADRRRQLNTRGILQQATDILKVLQNANVGTQEAKVLQAILTGEKIDDAEMSKLAVPIRQAIDELGQEAVSLGLISAESYERNRGAYLHRVYQKHELEQEGLAGWAGRILTNKRKKIIGDELKGRGMFWDVETPRLMRDVEDFQAGARGVPNKGEKFRVLDNVGAPTPDMETGEVRGKTLRRVYLPAEQPVPAKYIGPEWVDRGEWEVRSDKNGKNVTLWRDYTKAEREKMGEIVDARYTIGKTFMLMAHDLANGRFYQEIAEREAWAQSKPPAEKWVTADKFSRIANDSSIAWVQVPDTNIADSGGKKRWGALAGKYVRTEIWRDINEVAIANNPGTWRKLYTVWKKNKTARSPVTHMNNIMSNVMFMDLADVRMQDLIGGIREYLAGGEHYIEARDNGAFGGDMMSQEIRENVLKPLLEEMSRAEQGGAANPFLAKAGMLGRFADRLWTWAKTVDNGMLQAYQAEDEVFRMAMYMRRRALGESAEVAAKHAHEQFLNYDIRAPWVVAARNSLLPFVAYSYRAIPKIMENLAERPWKVAKYFAIAYALNALAYSLDDGDDGEERERAALRDEEQGYTWLGVPRMLRMPFRDSGGLPVFLDIRRWIPSGDVFDTTQGSAAIPIPAPLQFGGPIMMAAELMLNRQAFTGADITNELTDDNADGASNVLDYAWKSWMPSAFWLYNSWYWQKLSNAWRGAQETPGHVYSMPEAILSSIGVKARSIDVDDGLHWQSFHFEQVQRELKTQARRLSRQLKMGRISQDAFNDGMADLEAKFANLAANRAEFAKRSQPKRQ